MKFSVAPESRRATLSARFVMECIKNRIVIDFLAEIYTSSSKFRLIRADLIRQWENPPLLPYPWRVVVVVLL